MREITFRARNANVPVCWVYGYFVKEKGHCYIINNTGKFKVIAGTEGQHIGQDDKTGEEIYEGDIVSLEGNSENYQVYYEESHASYFLKCKEGVLFGGIDPDLIERIEIIGNIYENADLMGGQK